MHREKRDDCDMGSSGSLLCLDGYKFLNHITICGDHMLMKMRMMI